MNRAEKQRQGDKSGKAALNTQQSLDLAIQHHKAGDLPQAEGIYQQILQTEPNQPVALHLLGVLARQVGRNEDAVELINKAVAINPDYAEAHNNLGNALKDLGRADEAAASYRKALAINPDFAEAYSNLGSTLKDLDQLVEAVESYHKALAINPEFVEAHSNLGHMLKGMGRMEEAAASYQKVLTFQPDDVITWNTLGLTFHAMDKLEDAVASYQKALAIKPDLSQAHYNLGLTLHDLDQLDEAVESYRKALALQPDFALAHNNLGLALKDLGSLEDAVDCYRKALAIKPDLAEAHSNLGLALRDQENFDEAFACQRRAIALNPNNDLFWSGFAASLESYSFTSVDDDLLADLLQLLERPTVSPAFVTRPMINALFQHSEFLQILELPVSGGPETGIAYGDVAQRLSAIPLFLRIMGLSPINGLEIERMLTILRSAMLKETLAEKIDDRGIPFSTALALQCFTNEYVFSETDEEKEAVEQLHQRIAELVEKQLDVLPSLVATLGAYRPLHRFPWARELSGREWAGDIAQVIERQISEPLEELSLRSRISALTSIQDTVSQSVREQYEENPYPRWVKTGRPAKGKTLGAILQWAGIHTEIEDYVSPKSPEILVAGCGTGQHAVGTAFRFSNSRVLAVDLSLSSLSYAMRKTRELDVSNIEYAQADIMELDGLGRRFDLIESVGVLHHLGDPLAGWWNLVGLLGPGGLMKIGLYSEIARQDIVKGRALITEEGYTSSPEDIRRCRQDIITQAIDGNPEMLKICKARDFFSLSNCRDLLFHVQEHRFTLPQIRDALQTLGLEFLGFELQDHNVMRKFQDSHPEKSAQISLPLWHDFEIENPDSFRGMYQFWCKKI